MQGKHWAFIFGIVVGIIAARVNVFGVGGRR